MSQFFVRDNSSSSADIETLTGNTGGAVGPDAAFNVNILGSGNLTVTGNPATNTLTISENSAVLVTSYTDVTTSPYVVLTSDYYLSVSTSGGVKTIQLPNAPTQYRTFVIKDRTGNSGTNNITITTVGGVVNIDGAATYTMNQNYSAINLLFNGTSYEVF